MGGEWGGVYYFNMTDSHHVFVVLIKKSFAMLYSEGFRNFLLIEKRLGYRSAIEALDSRRTSTTETLIG